MTFYRVPRLALKNQVAAPNKNSIAKALYTETQNVPNNNNSDWAWSNSCFILLQFWWLTMDTRVVTRTNLKSYTKPSEETLPYTFVMLQTKKGTPQGTPHKKRVNTMFSHSLSLTHSVKRGKTKTNKKLTLQNSANPALLPWYIILRGQFSIHSFVFFSRLYTLSNSSSLSTMASIPPMEFADPSLFRPGPGVTSGRPATPPPAPALRANCINERDAITRERRSTQSQAQLRITRMMLACQAVHKPYTPSVSLSLVDYG